MHAIRILALGLLTVIVPGCASTNTPDITKDTISTVKPSSKMTRTDKVHTTELELINIALLEQWSVYKFETDRGTYITSASRDGPHSAEEMTLLQVVILGPACEPTTMNMTSYGKDANYVSIYEDGSLTGRVDHLESVVGSASAYNKNGVASLSWKSINQVQAMIESLKHGNKARFRFSVDRRPPVYFVFDSTGFASAYSMLETSCKADMAAQGRDPNLSDYFD